MKNSNYISESVFGVNLNYARLQNKTKQLFFECLNNGRDIEYFKAEIEELWGTIDNSYLEDQIREYEALIHEYNTNKKDGATIKKMFFALIPLTMIKKTDEKFVKIKEREYENSLNSYAYENNKEEYLKLKVAKYTNQTVPYYVYEETTGRLKYIRWVQPSTYNSMIHNTNLTRSGWNTTLNDADQLGINYFWIPYHNFSCEHCLAHQNRLLTKREVLQLTGSLEEASGDILHPNCKCVLTIYNADTVFNKPEYSTSELDEQYHIRQKVNGLTLKKEEILTDIKIQRGLGNEDEVDKLNKQREKVDEEIKKLVSALPTVEMKKQVVAINR